MITIINLLYPTENLRDLKKLQLSFVVFKKNVFPKLKNIFNYLFGRF